ncbi:MAG: DUF4194 domain-containing protein [Actinobacteria bacterium]|jgi:hypothetical protein|nr:DUF4194 domain-containing protein [Actinomycetota bacterium]
METEKEQQARDTTNTDLSTLAITLLRGVLYREEDEKLWGALLNLQPRVRDYVAVLNLDLVLDEAEGYAFLRSKPEAEAAEGVTRLPRLVARRPLSLPVSILLALLRKKLAEFDAGGGDTRLIMSRDDIIELMRMFLPDSSNEARLVDQIKAHINKVVELGFLRRMKETTGPENFEVQRILKTFINAQWLADLDVRLEAYKTQILSAATNKKEQNDE